MYYSLSGKLTHMEDGLFVVECGGVGYACRASLTTLSTLPPVGEQVLVYAHLHVQQDALELYGFFSRQEQEAFRMLIGVSGVGPKAALSLLSQLTPDALALAIAAGDTHALTRAKGVGAKAAQRILLELRDKISNEALSGGFAASAPAPARGAAAEAVEALTALGYTQSEAAAAVSGLPADSSAEDLIRAALRTLAR